MSGHLYFIGQRSTGPIKVGITYRDPRQRLDEIQRCSPVKLELLSVYYCQDPIDCEARIHAYLAHYRLWGEWFERIATRDLMAQLERREDARHLRSRSRV